MIIATLAAHLAVVALWCMAAGIAAGIGWLVHRGFGIGDARDGWAGTIWTGLATLVAFLHVWHFFRPIDGLALLSVGLAGIAGLAAGTTRQWRVRRVHSGADAGRVAVQATNPDRPRHAGDLESRGSDAGTAVATGAARRADRFAACLRVGALAFIALWLANRSLAPLLAHDSLMYVIPGVEWARAFPAVPGLGALHGRLAFNSSNILIAALVEAGPWRPASPHLVAGFFLFLLAAFATRKSRDGNDGPRASIAVTAFDRLLLVPLLAIALDDQLMPSLSADVGVAVTLLCAAATLNRGLLEPASSRPRQGEWVGAASAAVLAVTMKLSAAVTGTALWFVAVYLLLRTRRVEPLARRAVAACVAVAIAGLLTWTVHGVITSGYPFYPSTLLPVPVSWRVAAEQASAEAAWIGHFARTWPSTAVAHDGDVVALQWARFAWFRPWVGALAHGEDRGVASVPLVITAGLLPWLLIRAWYRSRQLWRRGTDGIAARGQPSIRTAGYVSPAVGAGAANAVRPTLGLLMGAAAGAAFWFVTAPRPSFGIASAWVLAGLLLGGLLSGVREPAAARLATVTPILLCILVTANDVAIDEPSMRWSPAAWRWTLLRDADTTHWFREPEAGPFVEFTTREGVTLSVPATGNLCARRSPPCTPHPSENLAWRTPGRARDGFVIRGDWQPLRWPKEGSHFLSRWRAARRASRPPAGPDGRNPGRLATAGVPDATPGRATGRRSRGLRSRRCASACAGTVTSPA